MKPEDSDIGTASQEGGKSRAGTRKAAAKTKITKSPSVSRPYPRRTIDEALRIPQAIKENNGGQPWPPTQVAAAVDLGMSATFFYLTAASRDFGFTEGTREASVISLTDLGRRVVYPNSREDELAARREGFFNVEPFAKLVEHFNGSSLPEKRFLSNTLETKFGLDPRIHDEFIDLFNRNCRFLGIGADFVNGPAESDAPLIEEVVALPSGAARVVKSTSPPTDSVQPVCFVIMPFSERDETRAVGFFEEVFNALFSPAIIAAGFTPKTAKRQGSDVIHSTIVTELLKADLVLADLTEHNPNVLFELGMRMAIDKPVALVRAKGTGPIFDVDNMLRVEDYNPSLWGSTVEKDLPRIQQHVLATWENRESDQTFLKILRANSPR